MRFSSFTRLRTTMQRPKGNAESFFAVLIFSCVIALSSGLTQVGPIPSRTFSSLFCSARLPDPRHRSVAFPAAREISGYGSGVCQPRRQAHGRTVRSMTQNSEERPPGTRAPSAGLTQLVTAARRNTSDTGAQELNDSVSQVAPALSKTSPIRRSTSSTQTLKLASQFDPLRSVSELTTDDGIPVSQLTDRSRPDWVRELVTTFNSRVLDRIINRMGFTVAWASYVTALITWGDNLAPTEWGGFTQFTVPGWPHELVGGFLSILLVFRTDQVTEAEPRILDVRNGPSDRAVLPLRLIVCLVRAPRSPTTRRTTASGRAAAAGPPPGLPCATWRASPSRTSTGRCATSSWGTSPPTRLRSRCVGGAWWQGRWS